MTSAMERIRNKIAELRVAYAVPPFSQSMAGVIILFVFTNSVATSIWMFNTWTPFIYILFGRSNLYVGLMAGVNGLFELSTAFVSGYIADKLIGPSRTLQGAVLWGMTTLLVVLAGIWMESTWILILAQCFEGTYMGFSFTCIESTFAQCVPTGERDRLYSLKFSCEASGPIAGLLLCATLLSLSGNEWTVPVLRLVMTAGLVLHLASMVTFLYLFQPLPWSKEKGVLTVGGALVHADEVTVVAATSDEAENTVAAPAAVDRVLRGNSTIIARSLEEDERYLMEDLRLRGAAMDDTLTLHDSDTAEAEGHTRSDNDDILVQPQQQHCDSVRNIGTTTVSGGAVDGGFERKRAVPGARNVPAEVPHDAEYSYIDHELLEASGLRRKIMEWIPLKRYPVFVVVSDVIMTFGSGMTTQYFPLFMMMLYHVSPSSLAGLNITNALVVASLALIGGAVGERYGRVRALLPPKVIGTFVLLWMALVRGNAVKWVMCVAYVVRGAFMNASAGLSRALIMDIVHERKRGRWNAVESIQSAGWSGTAILGGYLADQFGYGAAFIFTFGFHLTACLLLAPLMVRNDSRLLELVVLMPPPELLASPTKDVVTKIAVVDGMTQRTHDDDGCATVTAMFGPIESTQETSVNSSSNAETV